MRLRHAILALGALLPMQPSGAQSRVELKVAATTDAQRAARIRRLP